MRNRIGWVLLGLVLVAGGCAKSKNYKPEPLGVGNVVNCYPTTFKADHAVIPHLQLVASCNRFAGYLVASLSSSYGGPHPGATADSANGLMATEDSAPKSYSKTNVQEAGVDEPDLVKTDGKFLYVLSGNQLVILKSWPATELSTVAKLTIADWPTALVLEGDRLGVISQRMPPVTEEKPSFLPTMRLTVVNVSDRAKPVVERTVDLELWYQDARLINGRLVMVGESSLPMPELTFDKKPGDGEGTEPGGTVDDSTGGTVTALSQADDRRALLAEAVAKTRYEQWIPSLNDSAAPGRRLVVGNFEELFMPTVTGETGMLALVTVDLRQAGADLTRTAVVARGGMVYASTDGLYVSYTSGQWLWTNMVGFDIAIGAPWGGGGGGGMQTSIQKFALNAEGIPRYSGAATVEGWVGTPFQMSEYKDHLRVVSSAGGTNLLTILAPKSNGDLKAVGLVPSFAADESVTGARFIGDRAYVSTYHLVFLADPFFTFDLSVPTAPKLVGALEMPGYSAYLQPLDDQYVLALGMFAANMGDPVTAVQVQVFDVSDFAHPVTHAQYVIATGDGPAFSEALSSHHAFTWYPEEKIFAFPVSLWSGDWTSAFNGLMAFRIDTAAGITKLGQIDHRVFDTSSDWYGSDVRRSVFMTGGDGASYAYSLSNRGVLVNNVADFSTVLASEALPYHEPGDMGMPGEVRVMAR